MQSRLHPVPGPPRAPIGAAATVPRCALRGALAGALLAGFLAGPVAGRAGPVAGAGADPAPFEGRWRVVEEELEDARRTIARTVRRVEPLLRAPRARGRGPAGALPSTLLQGLSLPRVDLVIEDRGDAWVLVADGRERRRVARRAVVSRSTPIVRSAGVENGDLVVETANDAGTRIVERYRRAGPERLQLDLRLSNSLFDAPVETRLSFLALTPEGSAAPEPEGPEPRRR